MKPGTLQMHRGKWRICTARRGFPVRWEPFGAAWVVQEILARSGGFSLAIRTLAWSIAGKVAFKGYRKAKALLRQALDGPCSLAEVERVYLADWANWCGNLEMVARVKFKG